MSHTHKFNILDKIKEIHSLNSIPSINDIPNVGFCEYFEISSELICRIYEEVKTSETSILKFKGCIDKSNIFSIRFDIFKNNLLISLPDFNIKYKE